MGVFIAVGTKSHQFRSVQVLRGLAACLVVIVHSGTYWRYHAPGGLQTYGWLNGNSGVDIFFVISGLVMTLSTGRAGGVKPALEFMKRRVLRIAPLYWITTTIELGLRLHSREPNSGTPPFWVFCSYLFLPFRGRQPVEAAGWTLNFEMFFYLLFACAIVLNWRRIRFLAPVIVVLVLAGHFRQSDWPGVAALFDPLLLEFLGGVVLGYVVQSGFRLRAGWAGLLAVIGFAGLLLNPSKNAEMRVVLWGIPALLLVFSATMLEGRIGDRFPLWMLAVGDASYSLYLSHSIVLRLATAAMLRLHAPRGVTLPVCVVVSIFASLGVYRWVEKPITIALGHWMRVRVPRSVIGTEVAS